MSPSTKRRPATEDRSTLYAYSISNSTSTGYKPHGESQPSSSSLSASGRITASTSALLKALDAPTPSRGRKRAKRVSEDDVDGGEKPKAKRARKTKGADTPPKPEKRGAIFKKKCPKNVIDRVERVISQRFFMIDRLRNGNELKEEFSVLGSTGNVYTVAIDKRPSCTCPDAQKGNHCKHILFIFLKVLQVPQCSTLWYQKALLTSELEELFREAPLAPNAMASADIRNAYDRATGKALPSAKVDELRRRMPGADDHCPVCYEGMNDAQESSLTWCAACANALHKECFQQWAKSKRANPDCVYCRAPWTLEGANGTGGARTDGGYLNLAGVAGLSPVRDTSSYYHGPRRGQHYYGYQDYDDDFDS